MQNNYIQYTYILHSLADILKKSQMCHKDYIICYVLVQGLVLNKGSSKIINNLTWIIHMAISYKQTLSLHK